VRRLRRTIRRVRRALGEWRNYDVVLQSLERRRKATRSAPKRRLWAAVIDVLRARRVDEIRRARRKLGRIDLAKLAASIGHVARSGDDPALLRASIAGAVAEAWNGWRESLERAEGQRDPLSVHALRVATKRVRYGMELARHLGDESAEPAIAWLKRLQQALGEWHDEIVLRRLVAEAVARPDWLLEESDIARLALAELERDRGRGAAGVEEILRLANDLAGRDATQGWIDAAAVAAPRPAP
jgi:CHAD domain-containing protein